MYDTEQNLLPNNEKSHGKLETSDLSYYVDEVKFATILMIHGISTARSESEFDFEAC